MKRSIVVALLSLVLAVPSFSQVNIPPPGGNPGVRPIGGADAAPVIPQICTTPTNPGTFLAAQQCLNAIVANNSNIFPAAIIGYQKDSGGGPQVYASGPGLNTESVVSLASVTKPFVNVGLVKLVQDHSASAACAPVVTADCVFPQKFDTPLRTSLEVIDRLRGTDTVPRWFDRIDYGDAATQRVWKDSILLKHVVQMTAGFAPIAFTGYRFCPNGVCTDPVDPLDWTCDPTQGGLCRLAQLHNQYLMRRGPALPNGCKPRPVSGVRGFDFNQYYNGNVTATYRLIREFERRYSFEPGLFGECVLVEGPNGGSWIDGRAVREADIGKFYLGAPLLSAPGTQYHYAQPGFYITAYLIESVSGQRFDAYIKNKLFTPLGMNDTSFRVTPGSPQHQHLADLKRVPSFPTRVLPDIAAPLNTDLSLVHGSDKNWDELRRDWQNLWPEGGGMSTAEDMLRWLTFARTGKTATGQVLLNAQSVGYITTENDPVSSRTYGFQTGGAGVLIGNGYFGTQFKRDLNRCTSSTVLMQMITESPEGDPTYRVQLHDYQWHDMKQLRDVIQGLLDQIPSTCPAQ